MSGMTTGRTKAAAVVLDAIAIHSRVRGSLGAMVLLIDEAIRHDTENDPFLQQADDHLKRACELTHPALVTSCILQARAAVKRAKEIDFQDMSLAALRAMITELEECVEKAEDRGRELMGGLCEDGEFTEQAGAARDLSLRLA